MIFFLDFFLIISIIITCTAQFALSFQLNNCETLFAVNDDDNDTIWWMKLESISYIIEHELLVSIVLTLFRMGGGKFYPPCGKT